jgi:hypothetical protein
MTAASAVLRPPDPASTKWWQQAAGQAEGYARQASATALGGPPEDLPVKIVGAPGTPGAVLIEYASQATTDRPLRAVCGGADPAGRSG